MAKMESFIVQPNHTHTHTHAHSLVSCKNLKTKYHKLYLLYFTFLSFTKELH